MAQDTPRTNSNLQLINIHSIFTSTLDGRPNSNCFQLREEKTAYCARGYTSLEY